MAVQPTVVGTPTTAIKSSGSLVVPKPSGLADDTLLVCAIRDQNTAFTADFTLPSGFTRQGPGFVPSSAARVIGIYTKFVTDASAEPATYTFTPPAGAAASRGAAEMWRVEGANPATLVDVISDTYEGTSITGGRRVPSIDVEFDDSLLIFVGAAGFSASQNHVPTTTPAGVTLIGQATSPSEVLSNSRDTIWAGWKAVDAGPTGNLDIAWAAISTAAAEVIVLRPGPDPEPPSAPQVAVWDGADEVPAGVYVYDGAAELPAADVLALPKRSHTIAEMLADTPFVWAHRGGFSAIGSEFTMRAITNAVWAYNVPCIEYSCHRTSDGVFVGMHDATVDRTTALSGNVSAFTWATLSATAVDVPVSDGGTVSRLEDLLDSYGQDFVTIIEDKTYSNMAAMIALIKARVPDWQDRVIIKGFADASSGWAAAAKAAGFTTWGYLYDGQILTANLSNCDMVGLNYEADQAYWDAAVNLEKPLVTNALGSAAAAAEGAAKIAAGAANVSKPVPPYGFQTTNPSGILPVINAIP